MVLHFDFALSILSKRLQTRRNEGENFGSGGTGMEGVPAKETLCAAERPAQAQGGKFV